MIDMLSTVKDEFPELYTKKGEVRKQAPKRFKCMCGNEFNRTKNVKMLGITFGVSTCNVCGEIVKEAKAYSVWKRLINGQIEQEDYILNVVKDKPGILKEDLQDLMSEKFKENVNALGHLVYFGYLQVDKEKRDTMNIIEYTINPNKNLSKRYKRIL